MDGADQYIDEDRALGFHVWVAELELLVGSAKDKSIDQVAAFELLQKVLVTSTTTDAERVKEYQRRCEICILDILLKGAAPPVRRLVCLCLSSLYMVGDALSMYARSADLRAMLAAKDAKSLPDITKLGVLQCLATLCERHGQKLVSGMADTLSVALKYSARGVEFGVRLAALDLAAKVVAGLGARDRTSLAVQTDALKCAVKVAKESPDASSHRIKLASARILGAICQAEGMPLWSNTSWYDEVLKLCLSHLEDEDTALGDAFSSVLGDLASAATSQAARDAVQALEKKASKKAALEQILKHVFDLCLVIPFTSSTSQKPARARTTLTRAWLSYLGHVQVQKPGDDHALVELAVRALEMLSNVAGPGGEGADLGWYLASGELPQAQACVLYILRIGIIERIGEAGQRIMLERLVGVLGGVLGARIPVAIATLEAMELLLEVLGEVAADQVAALEAPICQKLVSGSAPLRRQAAKIVAGLGVAEHGSAARLLQDRLDSLANSAARMATLCGPEPPDDHQEGQLVGTPRGMHASETQKLKPSFDAVHGNALAVAALLVATARLPLGIPSRLQDTALDLAELLIEHPTSKRASGRATEREAGYILLGALFSSWPLETLEEKAQFMVQLFHTALAAESVAELDLRKYLTISQAKAEVNMSVELWWRSAALEAFKALILSPLATKARHAAKLQKRIGLILQPALTIILSSPVLQDPQRAKGILGGACATFQLRLLEAYLAIPNPKTFTPEHEVLSRLCTRAFRTPLNPVPGQLDVASTAASSALRELLDKQDVPLGPWVAGRGPLEDALHAFTGSPGGPSHQFHASSTSGTPPASSEFANPVGVSDAGGEPFPQPRSLSAALLECQMVLLGNLLAVVGETNQVQILELLLVAARGPPARPGLRESPQRRQSVITSVCCTALAGLDSLARRFKGKSQPQALHPQSSTEDRDAVAERARLVAEAALEEGSQSGDVALLRSSAEMFALAACIGSDANAILLLRALCGQLASATSPPRRMALSLALGCIYRSKGGIALQATVSEGSTLLLAAAEVSSGPTQLWLMHALMLVANAAGLSFIPHVKGSLALMMRLLMSEDPEVLPGLRPSIGRLANAIVTVLGPEMSSGSIAYTTTRALIHDLQFLSEGAVSAEEATMAEMERVLYIQALVLFAPHAVPAAAHLPLLLKTLGSKQPALRKAAADTLRHLAERDPGPILPVKVETSLFGSLDSEVNAGAAAQLKATIYTLLSAGAGGQPGHYLATCEAIILAPTTAVTAKAPASQDQTTVADGDDSGDEDSTAARQMSHAAASTSQPESQPSRAVAAATTRLRTRVFAADCLLDLLRLCASDRRHFDPFVSRDNAGDWLVLQLQGLIDVGFKMSTGSVEALRPAGLKLLLEILVYFGQTPDPLLPEARLLDQSQAQFITAIRSALSSRASPSLTSAGALLAAEFMKRGLTQGDAGLLGRLMTMLTAPLAATSQHRLSSYADWVSVQARVAVLEANAICIVYLLTSSSNELQDVLQAVPNSDLRVLVEQWGALVQDWLVLTTQAASVQAEYRPRLISVSSPLVFRAVLPLLRQAWAPCLAAAAQVLALCAQEDTEIEATLEEYHLLIDACYYVLSTAQPNNSEGSGDVLVVLSSLTHLLGPCFKRHYGLMLLKDVTTAVGSLTLQGELSERTAAAAAQVLAQICATAPAGYLSSHDLLQPLLAAILAFLPGGGRGPEATMPPAAVEAATAAAAQLTGKIQGPTALAVVASVALKALALLRITTEGTVMTSASAIIQNVAQQSAGSFQKEHKHANGSFELPMNTALLAYTCCSSADLLEQLPGSFQTNDAIERERFAVTLNLVLTVGALLPAKKASLQLPHLQLLDASAPEPAKPSPIKDAADSRSAAASDSNLADAAAESEDWAEDAVFLDAESAQDDDWDDIGFQDPTIQGGSAPASPSPRGSAEDSEADAKAAMLTEQQLPEETEFAAFHADFDASEAVNSETGVPGLQHQAEVEKTDIWTEGFPAPPAASQIDGSDPTEAAAPDERSDREPPLAAPPSSADEIKQDASSVHSQVHDGSGSKESGETGLHEAWSGGIDDKSEGQLDGQEKTTISSPETVQDHAGHATVVQLSQPVTQSSLATPTKGRTSATEPDASSAPDAARHEALPEGSFQAPDSHDRQLEGTHDQAEPASPDPDTPGDIDVMPSQTELASLGKAAEISLGELPETSKPLPQPGVAPSGGRLAGLKARFEAGSAHDTASAESRVRTGSEAWASAAALKPEAASNNLHETAEPSDIQPDAASVAPSSRDERPSQESQERDEARQPVLSSFQAARNKFAGGAGAAPRPAGPGLSGGRPGRPSAGASRQDSLAEATDGAESKTLTSDAEDLPQHLNLRGGAGSSDSDGEKLEPSASREPSEDEWGDTDFLEAGDDPAEPAGHESADDESAGHEPASPARDVTGAPAQQESSGQNEAAEDSECASPGGQNDGSVVTHAVEQEEAVEPESPAAEAEPVPSEPSKDDSNAFVPADVEIPDEIVEARRQCLHAVGVHMNASSAASVQTKVLQTIRLLLTKQTLDDREAYWRLCCALLLVPKAAGLLHSWNSSAEFEAKPSDQILVISEALKLVVSTLPVATKFDPGLEAGLLELLVQLFVVSIEVAQKAAEKNEGGAEASVIGLVGSLMALVAGGKSGAAFRQALLILPPHCRQKLQVALQAGNANAKGNASGPQGTHSNKQPSIALKTFATIKPPTVRQKAPSPVPSFSGDESDFE